MRISSLFIILIFSGCASTAEELKLEIDELQAEYEVKAQELSEDFTAKRNELEEKLKELQLLKELEDGS